MRIKKHLLLLLFIAAPALCRSQGSGSVDVRAAQWGMSRAGVMKAEKGRMPQNSTPEVISYEGVEIGKYFTRIEYRFIENKLNSVDVVFPSATANTQDFRIINGLLKAKYGKPLHEVVKSYATTNYLKSDTTMAIYEGKFNLYSNWTGPRTNVMHTTGPKSWHVISYTPTQPVVARTATGRDF